jgi:hypothetical protein
MSKSPKQRSSFRNETEEREFWESHASSGHVDWTKAERARLPNLKSSTQSDKGHSRESGNP